MQRLSVAPLALTMGEPAGIGPDITLKTWENRKSLGVPPFFYIGCPRVLADRADLLGYDIPFKEIPEPAAAPPVFPTALPVYPLDCAPVQAGQPSTGTADAVIAAIERGVALTQSGDAAALVTNPIAKSVLARAGFRHPGHTEFLGALARRQPGSGEAPHAVMMLASETLKVVPVTVHIPLADVPGAISKDLIVRTATIVGDDLAGRFGITRPRIAISGLNPHSGEDGLMGGEDFETITPAVQELQRSGIDASGPWPADSMFHAGARRNYDAALCMYHDQALIPIKTLAFDRAVNVTLGLDFIRTSPDHGTAFDIVGTGQARETSLAEALGLAVSMAENASYHGL